MRMSYTNGYECGRCSAKNGKWEYKYGRQGMNKFNIPVSIAKKVP
jgi:hypothetical protein